jgi:hypothetical protein
VRDGHVQRHLLAADGDEDVTTLSRGAEAHVFAKGAQECVARQAEPEVTQVVVQRRAVAACHAAQGVVSMHIGIFRTTHPA